MSDKILKLLKMSKTEAAHRLRERMRRAVDRARFHGHLSLGNEANEDSGIEDLARAHGGSLRTYFEHGPAERFYLSTQDREGLVDLVLRRYPDWVDRAVQQAETLCEHRVDLLAYRGVPLGENIDWHRDPVSGFQWPRRYWADYDLVSSPPADAKVIHELNRQQHLPRLAKAFFFTGDERYANEAIVQMESWIEQNPRWNGVNWKSSLEIAIRTISWLWTIFLLLPSKSLTEERLRTISRSLFTQFDHVCRYPSVYTSPNTHLIGEAAALFMAGVLFPELSRARIWHEFAARTLTQELHRQVCNDGVYGELSSYYHCYATDFYLHVLVLSQTNRLPIPEGMLGRVSRMLDFVMHVTRADRSIPLLGDDDGGRVLAIASENYSSYCDGLCSGAVLLGRPDLKYQAGDFCEDSLWLLGPDAWSTYASIAAHAPAELTGKFADAGYFIQRSGWAEKDTQVVFDCGGLGLGSGGHGHADALSLTMFSGGREFLIDPGTSVYNCATGWRRFFRSTAAHNTVVVDNASQSEPGGTFQWRTKAKSSLHRQISLSDIEYVDGAVEFRNSGRIFQPRLFRRPQIRHRRRLVQIRPNYWIVLDEVTGEGVHDFDFLYHFAPETRLTVFSEEQRGEVDCRARIERAEMQLHMYASEPVTAEAVCGQFDRIQGWTSSVYGERRASPVLKVSLRGEVPVSMMTLLSPGSETIRSRRLKANSNRTNAAVIRDGNFEDILVMAVADGDLRLTDYSMRGEFFWIRTEHGNLRRLVAVNASSFSCAGEKVLESAEPIPWAQVHFWDNGIVIERGDQEGDVYVRDLRDRQFQRN